MSALTVAKECIRHLFVEVGRVQDRETLSDYRFPGVGTGEEVADDLVHDGFLSRVLVYRRELYVPHGTVLSVPALMEVQAFHKARPIAEVLYVRIV